MRTRMLKRLSLLFLLMGVQPLAAEDYWDDFVERDIHQISLVTWYELNNANKCLFEKQKSGRQLLNLCAKGINETVAVLRREILTPTPGSSKERDRMGFYGLIVEQHLERARAYFELGDENKCNSELERAINAARASKNRKMIAYASRVECPIFGLLR